MVLYDTQKKKCFYKQCQVHSNTELMKDDSIAFFKAGFSQCHSTWLFYQHFLTLCIEKKKMPPGICFQLLHSSAGRQCCSAGPCCWVESFIFHVSVSNCTGLSLGLMVLALQATRLNLSEGPCLRGNRFGLLLLICVTWCFYFKILFFPLWNL